MIVGLRSLLILMAVGCCLSVSAQTDEAGAAERYVIAYRTEITTTAGQKTGVLEQVTDSNVVVRNDLNGYDYIPVPDIKIIRIKFRPDMATYTVQNFYDTDKLDKTREGFIDLNSPRNQRYLNSSVAEQVIGNVFFNAAGILGTKGVNKLRKGLAGTITKFRVNGSPAKYTQVKPELQLYALQYQLSPAYDDYLREALTPHPKSP